MIFIKFKFNEGYRRITIMKRRRKVLAVLLTASLCSAMGISVPKVMDVKADGMKVVTLGQDLSKEQQDKIMKYFGANYDEVELLYINNQQEREALGSYIPLSQIGTHTYSCAMVKPTSSGGIQVKTANLNYVTCNMIASTLTTSGVTNCQVLAAAPFEVSGTGALTGITLAYEKATDTTLDPVKKDLANQEMVVTGGIAEELGQSAATAVVNETKENVIEGNVTEIGDINNIVNNVTNEYNVEMNDEDKQKLAELMQQIAEQDYDIAQIKANLDKVQANVIDDTSASEEKKTEVAKQAEASAEEAQRVAQEAQNLAQSSTAGADEEKVEGSVEVPTDSEGNILDSTDSSAFGDTNINEGTTTETVTDQQTTDGNSEETKQTGAEGVWNETSGTFDGAEQGTEQEAEQNTSETENTETQTTEGETVDGSVEVPEGTENTGDTESTPTEEPTGEPTSEEPVSTDGASDEITADIKEVYDNLDKAFEGNVIIDSNGVSVYLPEATVTDMKTNILNRYAEILLSGADTPVSDDAELQAKYDTVLDDTRDKVEVKEYKDEKLVAMDKYLRYYVLENAPKQFDDSNLVDSDKVAVYEAAMKVFEEKFGESSTTEEAEGTTEEVPEDGSAEASDATTEESAETEGTNEVADTEVAE